MPEPLRLHDLHPAPDGLIEEVLDGLRDEPKQLPAKLFYDERGSQLFDRITRLPEYYPTRTEAAIMRDHAQDIADALGPRCLIVEYGSGSSEKTRILLDHLTDPVAYVPIDISREHLLASAGELADDYPHIEVLPVCADYEQDFRLPQPERAEKRDIVYFPGSTIGNFHEDRAVEFLAHNVDLSGEHGRLLIGVDLKKDPEVLHNAYNDREGVTAAFNLNMLLHLNRVFDANFDIEQFRHVAFYNETVGRIEMHLESAVDQTVTIGGARIALAQGERIWTESSYKYSIEGFSALAARAGYRFEQAWSDEKQYFGVMLFSVASSPLSDPVKHSRLAGILVAVAVTAVAVIIAEVGLSAFAPVPDPHERLLRSFPQVNQYIRMEFPRNFHATTQPEEGLPGVSGENRFTTNNMGFRGSAMESPKPTDEYRVFLVGGSTTECFYLDDRDAIDAVVERALESALPGRPIRVYGVGLSGAASDDHVAMIANRLAHMSPDMVVLFCGINDLTRAIYGFDYAHYTDHYDLVHVPDWKRFLLTSQIIRRWYYFKSRIDPNDREIQESMTKTSNYAGKIGLQRATPATAQAPRTDLASYRRNLQSIAGLASAHGFELVLMTQPSTWASAVDPDAKRWHWMRCRGGATYSEDLMDAALESYNDVMRELAGEGAITLYDLAGELPKSLEYFYDDCHFNTRGAAAVGAGLARHIVDSPLISP